MKFRIKVEVLQPRPDKEYEQWTQVYEQTAENVDLAAVVAAVNPELTRSAPSDPSAISRHSPFPAAPTGGRT